MLYANGRDLKDPLLSPIYGDVRGFPPAILTSGTRDLYLSNTVRMHRKAPRRRCRSSATSLGRPIPCDYMADINAPETKQYHDEVARFFDPYLGKAGPE